MIQNSPLSYILRKMVDYLRFLDIHKAKRLELYNKIPICDEIRILRLLEEKDSERWSELEVVFDKIVI